MQGTVVKSTGMRCRVRGDDGLLYTCYARGKLRLTHTSHSNPVAVGDRVKFIVAKEGGNITEVLPRANLMERKATKRSAQSQTLAANIDQVLLLATLAQPVTSTGFIDRVLASAESFRIPQLVVFNKKDLLAESGLQQQRHYAALYRAVGAETLCVSLLRDTDIALLQAKLDGKTTLLIGLSGVGKSTLMNRLVPDASQLIRPVSSSSQKGAHTTTYAEMFRPDPHTALIDTPGIKEWGVVDMTPDEVADYFPEMRALRDRCQYGSRCRHRQEPACAVRDAVAAGHIADSRYKSYLSIIADEDNRA